MTQKKVPYQVKKYCKHFWLVMAVEKRVYDGDEAVRFTNDDASICKRFAVHVGYWTDPYISLFIRNTERKTPEINRGYYARVKAITILIQKFIKVKEVKVI